MLEDERDLAARLDRIKWLTDELATAQRDTLTAKLLLADIQRELAITRNAVQILETHPRKHNHD